MENPMYSLPLSTLLLVIGFVFVILGSAHVNLNCNAMFDKKQQQVKTLFVIGTLLGVGTWLFIAGLGVLAFETFIRPDSKFIVSLHQHQHQKTQALGEPSTVLKEAKNWPLAFEDDFDDNQHQWSVGKFRDPYLEKNWQIIDGKYRWTMQALQADSWWFQVPDMPAIDDFYLAVDISPRPELSDTTEVGNGLVLRRNSNDVYRFSISASSFAIYRYQQHQWTELSGWNNSKAIYPGDTNRLAVIAKGGHFYFYINDNFVAEVTDYALDSGTAGVFVHLYQKDDQATVDFDNFELRRYPYPNTLFQSAKP